MGLCYILFETKNIYWEAVPMGCFSALPAAYAEGRTALSISIIK